VILLDNEFDLDEKMDPFFDEYQEALVHAMSDRPAAIEIIEKLAKSGSILSILYIADSLRTGWIYGKDLIAAEEWYRIAISSGSNRGQYGLGLVYHAAAKYDQAILEFESSASKQYPPSMFMLGWMYYFGQSVDVCFNKAKFWWLEGAIRGHYNSMKYLSDLIISGKFGLFRLPIGYLWRIRATVNMVSNYYRNNYSYRFR
jgi:TPR repeat protein